MVPNKVYTVGLRQRRQRHVKETNYGQRTPLDSDDDDEKVLTMIVMVMTMIKYMSQ